MNGRFIQSLHQYLHTFKYPVITYQRNEKETIYHASSTFSNFTYSRSNKPQALRFILAFRSNPFRHGRFRISHHVSIKTPRQSYIYNTTHNDIVDLHHYRGQRQTPPRQRQKRRMGIIRGIIFPLGHFHHYTKFHHARNPRHKQIRLAISTTGIGSANSRGNQSPRTANKGEQVNEQWVINLTNDQGVSLLLLPRCLF